MTTLQRTDVMTVEEFDQWVMLPENVDKNFEYIGGRIVEVSSNAYSSQLAAYLLIFIGTFVLRFELGRMTTTDGGYWISGERYIPDVAFISYARQPEASRDGYYSIPPDLAVEVLSPSNRDEDMQIKIANYLKVGTTTWVFDPDSKQAAIYVPGQPVQIVGTDGVIDGGTVLPGFSLSMRELFRIADRKLSDVQKPATDTPNA